MKKPDGIHEWSEDENDKVWQLYHLNSKNRSTELSSLFLSGYALFQKQPEKMLPFLVEELSCKAIAPSQSKEETQLEREMLRRRSSLSFASKELKYEQLSLLLRAGFGSPDGASAPSAGGLYPIDLFCISLAVENLDTGLYFYDREKGVLGKIIGDDVKQRLEGVFVQNHDVLKARAVFFFVATFGRSTRKYGERGYRYALLEAGHIAQNLLLLCGQLGLSAACLGGFLDHKAENLIGIDGERQSVVYSLVVG